MAITVVYLGPSFLVSKPRPFDEPRKTLHGSLPFPGPGPCDPPRAKPALRDDGVLAIMAWEVGIDISSGECREL